MRTPIDLNALRSACLLASKRTVTERYNGSDWTGTSNLGHSSVAFQKEAKPEVILHLLDRLATAEASLKAAEFRLSLLADRNQCLCSDCRDKVPRGECPRCHGQRAHPALPPTGDTRHG